MRMWINRSSHSLLIGMKHDVAILEDSLEVSDKTDCTLYHQSNNHSSQYLRKAVKKYVLCPHKTCTQMSISVSPIIAKPWKRLRHPSLGEQIDKLWYNQKMEYYKTLKRTELSSYEKTWRNLKCILLRKANLKSYILYDYNYMTLWKRENHGDSKKMRGWRMEKDKQVQLRKF